MGPLIYLEWYRRMQPFGHVETQVEEYGKGFMEGNNEQGLWLVMDYSIQIRYDRFIYNC